MRNLLRISLGALLLTGCGLSVRSADLFLLKRSGQPGNLTLLVNDGGTIKCNDGHSRPLPDPLLIRARSLASDLNKDVKSGLKLRPSPGSVASYSVRLQDGTLAFPDTAAAGHQELAQAELFAIQAAQQACGLSG